MHVCDAINHNNNAEVVTMMTNIVIFAVFLAATLIGCILADAKNIRQEFNQMQKEHDLEVRRINADFNDKRWQLYIRYGKIL